MAVHRVGDFVRYGGGFSTLIARRAIAYANLETTLTLVNPSPRTDVARAADAIVTKRLEDMD